MSTIIQGNDLRTLTLGQRAEKSTGTLAATTISLFTIAGGVVAITSIYGEVTTAVTVANSYKLQANPTTGTTSDLVAATDIGTTDSPAGNILTFDGIKASSIQGAGTAGAGSSPMLLRPIAINTGTIESVSAGTDGVILWVVTWVPLTSGATLVAA
jgi:hypothetical protein